LKLRPLRIRELKMLKISTLVSILIFCGLLYAPLKMHAQEYNPADVEVINTLIKNNCLLAERNAPSIWEFATWDNSNPKKIIKLNLNNRFLCGEASFVGLTQLKKLTCKRNNLTKLDVSKCSQLQDLRCNKNSLIKLDVTGCTQLWNLECKGNKLTELDVSECKLIYGSYDENVKLITKKETLERRNIEEQKVIVKNFSFSSFVQNYVVQEMEKWLKKGEFEKTDEWQQRISEDSRKAAELLQAAEQAYIAERSKNIPVGNLTLGTYEADEEYFLIRNSVHGNYRVYVPRDEAPNFKNNWNRHITPQYTIISDQLMLAGYKYNPIAVSNNSVEQKENQTNANQSTETKQREQVIENVQQINNSVNTHIETKKSLPNKAGQVSIGISPVLGIDGVYVSYLGSTPTLSKVFASFGICGKFRVGIAKPIRLEASFTYYPPKKLSMMGIKRNLWDVSLNMQMIFTKQDKFIPYPLLGLGILGEKLSAFNENVRGTIVVMNVGSGFDVKLSNVVFFNTELKYAIVFRNGHMGRFAISSGLIFRF